MNRWELLNALRSYAHPSWYQSLFDWPTSKLAVLLACYLARTEDSISLFGLPRIYKTKGLGDEPNPRQLTIVVGVDLAHTGGHYVLVQHHPDGRKEILEVLNPWATSTRMRRHRTVRKLVVERG